jgi:hypothetical protein
MNLYEWNFVFICLTKTVLLTFELIYPLLVVLMDVRFLFNSEYITDPLASMNTEICFKVQSISNPVLALIYILC